ncbi:hemagglutinin repeat-containing protein [Franconibacter helveticus 513]|uniref:hemagglutinin repeat-containing protein n=1 Tax=Franconibacter helveticus TaxID=357240 RepID=UPI00041EFFED|nr:hemagglutinin repeat-containing protein [Franconibacter helveticus]
MDNRHPPVSLSKRLLSWTISVLLVWQPVAPAFAAAMTPTGQTTMDQAGNGVPVVNIATPNAAGLSHNQFQDYNVGKEGLILNNATGQLTQTQLGGLIQNNPHLKAGLEAKGIINEVTGASRSQLQGYTEVAGKAANVMVANPYGITCNGCGFINTPNVTLTTGKPQFDANGNLMALDVTKGAITVEGQGLDASQSDALSIIARATEVNAAIHAKDLSVTAGANRVGTDGSLQATAGEGPAPTVAVDTGALGGMYANRIRLVSSEKGVGVNLGNLNARQGDIQLDASGRMTVKNSLASGSLNAKGEGVTLAGSHQTGGALSVASTQAMTLDNATLASGGDARLTSDGRLQINGGGVTSSGALDVASGQDAALANATLVGQGNTTLSSHGGLNINGGGVSGNGALTVASQQDATLSNATLVGLSETRLHSNGALKVEGGSLASRGGLNVSASQSMRLENTTAGSEEKAVFTSGGQIASSGSTLTAGSDLALSGGSLAISGGALSAHGALDLTGLQGLSLENSKAGSGTYATLTSNGQLAVTGGSLTAGSDLLLNGGALAVRGGSLSGKGALTLSAGQDLLFENATAGSGLNATLSSGGTLEMTGGSLIADGDLTLNGGSLAVRNASLSGQGALSLTGGQRLLLDNATAGSGANALFTSNGELTATGSALTAGNDLTLTGTQMSLDAGSRTGAKANVRLNGGDIHNQGEVNAGNDALITGRKVVNEGQLAANGRLDAQTISLNNSGLLQGNGVTLKGDALENSGTLQSGGALDIHVKNLAQQGALGAKGDARITAQETLRNGGSLLADGALAINTATLEQNGTLSGAKNLTVDAEEIASGKGSLVTSQGDVRLAAGQRADINGQVIASGALDVRGETVTTGADAHLQSDNDLTLQATTAQLGGTQAAKGAFGVTAQQIDHGGKSNASSITFTAPQSVTNSGTLEATTLTLSGDSITNRGALLADTLALGAQTLINSGGVKAGALTLDGESLTNSGTLAADTLALRGNHFTNSGLVQGADLLNLQTDTLDNLAGGTLYSAQNLALSLPTLNNSGLITTDRDLILKGDQLSNSGEINGVNLRSGYATLINNADGRLLADNNLTLNGLLIDNSGLLAAKTLSLTTDTLTNRGEAQGDGGLTITAQQTSNSGALRTGGTLDLQGATLGNDGEMSATDLLLNLSGKAANTGRIIADNGFTIAAPELINSGLLAASDLRADAFAITNSGTLQGAASLNATGKTLDNQQGGALLSGGALELQNDRLTNAGLLQGKTLNLATGEWINSGNALGEAGLTAKVSGAFSNQGKVLSQQAMDLRAETLDNRGALMAKVLALHGDLQNSGLLQGSSALNWDGNVFTNLAQGQATGGETLTLTGKTLDNQGQLQARSATLTGETLRNSGSAQALESLNASISGRADNQGALLSQNRFELAAAQLFNDGQLAAKSVTLSAPQLTNNGLIQGNESLALATRDLLNGQNGQLISASGLNLDLNSLQNQGLLLATSGFTLKGKTLVNGGDIQADSLNFTLADTLDNQGGLVAKGQSALSAATLTNGGTLASQTLTLGGTAIRNSGLIQGNGQADATANTITNDAAGKWLSGGALTFNGGTLTNAGAMQGATLGLTASTLNNSGVLTGASALTGAFTGALNNSGQIQSNGALGLTADSLINPGRIAGDTLTLNAATLSNDGLWQGVKNLTLTGDTLTTGAASRTLTGGALALNAGQLNTLGTLQGQGVEVNASGWTHGGSLLSLGNLTADVGGTFANTGSAMSKGDASLVAQLIDNGGQLLSEGNATLDGQSLKNRGAVQGKTLALHQTSINNQGTLTGLQSLTLEAQQRLMARMLMAAPQQELINGASGALLTQGTLKITSGTVTNAGSWQGQNVILNAQSLANSGAVQSADALQMTLANTLNSTAGSKITAMGNAALSALSLTNQGQWAAKNLTLSGNTFNNDGDTSGVNGLTVTLNGAFTQQAGRSLLTGGALNLSAASVTNLGKLQGNTLGVSTGALNNSGRLQGDNGATFSLSGRLTNNAGGEIVSQQGLTVTTPELFNYGLMQGGGDTRVDAASQAYNNGKLLSGATLTLTTPQYTDTGWLQASNLVLNAANATNGGTWLADQATLTGSQFTNQGTTQGGTLAVNYSQLNNNGTLLGTSQLNVNAGQVNQSAAGKLFSAGNLWLGSNGFDSLGQVVALGDLTLKLTNAYTNKTALAAGRTLTLTSNGAIDNQSVMQGQAVNVSAGGVLTNNSQITTGSGASTFSGSAVALNGAGSIQGGGDIAINSGSNITVNGFTGTRGSLTLSGPGSIINTALLYAANNLALYANSITNQRGDILAGNSLWMQRDGAGNANAEVVNTSGTIETQNGDITINTGHLLNTRDGLSVKEEALTSTSSGIDGLGNASINVPVALLPEGSYGAWSRTGTGESGPCGTHSACNYYNFIIYTYAPFQDTAVQKFVASQKKVSVVSNGGAARISSGRDLTIGANNLENSASNILANRNIALRGSTLNNQSWTDGTVTDYFVYEFKPSKSARTKFATVDKSKMKGMEGYRPYLPEDTDVIPFQLTGHTSERQDGQIYRAVIQAGGNVSANFTSNISNTNTTANAGGVSNTISTPSLTTLSNQSVSGSIAKQNLTSAGPVAVNSPQWKDQLQGALQQINGGGALEATGAANASLAAISTTQKGNASLGSMGNLANAGVTTAALSNAKGGALGQYQGKAVDTSAYPLPSGDNGYFVVSTNPKSPYLITVNPKLNGLGQLDPSLFGDLNALLGLQPSTRALPGVRPDVGALAGVQPGTTAPQETRAVYTDEKQFLGSSYMLGRLNLNPDYDYRFLGDAAFDTRYVSNYLLNQTGNRYLNGIGSDLDQMRYLMDNAASAQQSLGLKFGVSLTADQVAALDHSILWWETATINGETVMIPKVYLSPKDVTVNNGSVIAGNNVSLQGGNITNSGSTLVAKNNLSLDSQNSISNLNDGLMKAGGDLNLSAIGDINNISSAINGKTVQLESLDGSINNITLADQIDINAKGKYGSVSLKDTVLGSTASITAQDVLSLSAGKDITLTGANLASGGDMLLDAWGDIAVNANQVNDAYSQSGFRGKTNTSRSTVSYQGSTISAGGNLDASAGHNLSLTASDVKAGGSAALAAGNDLNLNAAQTSQNSASGKNESHSTGLDRATVAAGDNLTLKAGQDINSQAAALAATNNVGMQAGRDVNLAAEATTEGDSARAKKKTVINESVRQQGTEIASGGNTVIVAGQDVNAQAAQVTAQGDIGVAAGRDVNLTTATESDYYYKEQTKTKKGFLSKKTTHTIQETSATREAGTLLSGDNVQVSAGNNLLVQGSAVAGDGNVALGAGNNVDIVAATNTDTSWNFKETKKSGLMGSGGIGFTIGSSKTTHDLREKGTTQSQSTSTVGSTGGNVTVTAGNQAHVGGADLIAGKDLTITGDSVVIEPGHDKRTRDEKFEQKSSGLTLALSGVVGSALNSAVSAAQSAKESSDSRVAALQATKAALSGYQASQGSDLLQATNDPSNGFGVSVSLTSQKSKSQQHQETDTVSGSTLNAGNNLAINATGKGGSANSGDILIGGSQLKAGGDATLSAANDILLTGAANTEKTTGKNSSSGGGIGVSIGGGSNGGGISVFANVNAAKGHDKGNGTSWSETTVDSGGTVKLQSGRDTTLTGAQVNGDKVIADVGRDLTLASQQDSNRYDSKQTSFGAGGSFTFGSMTGSGYLNLSQDKMHSTFDSVAEQSGIYAGKGGFDITVGNHTQLDGAVIASTATADKNRLDTGTLGFSDIQNRADYKIEHQGASFSTGGGIAGNLISNMANTMLAGMGGSGHAEGTTQSAVADGAITIRDQANQQQDLANLSRDTEHANDSISPIFDKEKEQNRLQTAQLIGEIGMQVSDIVKTQGAIEAAQKANSQMAGVTQAQKDEALKALQAQDRNKQYSDKEINQQVWQNFYDNAQKNSDYGTGGKYQRAVQAVTAAVQGLAGGDVQSALAGGAAPYLADVIGHKLNLDEGSKAIAHAIAGAVVAELQGRNALAGAAGAVAGEQAANILLAQMFPGKSAADLTEEEKQTISAFSTLAAGLAGGIAGDSSASALTGAQAGKNAVENNALSVNKLDGFAERARNCEGAGCEKVVRDMIDSNIEVQEDIKLVCSISAELCQQKYGYLVDQWSVFETTVKHMAEDETLPSDFRNALAPVYTLSMEAEGIMANQGWTERFEAMGFDAETASKIAMTLPALYGATKGAKGPTSATATAQTVKPQTLDPRYANDTWKPIKRYQLVEKDGVWYTVGESGSMFRAKGTYDYVTIGGKVYVSRTSSKEGDVGHYDISRGASQVDYAGSVKFGWSEGTRGVLQGFDNSSGHYKPSANNANQSGLPLDKFREHSAK